MKKSWLCLIFISVVSFVRAQTLESSLAARFREFESDAQLKAASISLYIVEAKSGKVVFDRNSATGLAPASTQKVITAATAYELLGQDFRYQTLFGYTGTLVNGSLDGALVLRGSGDPTLGSWRWKATSEKEVMDKFLAAIDKLNIRRYGGVIVYNVFDEEALPDGWIWQDAGNYYGAAPRLLNWRENQFDLVLQSQSKIGSEVSVFETTPKLYHYSIRSAVKAAAPGTGDQTYIYLPISDSIGVARGTIPVSQKRFTVSGSIPDGGRQLAATLIDSLSRRGISSTGGISTTYGLKDYSPLYRHQSPGIDSITYFLLKKSINLYGEALLRSMGYGDNSQTSTEAGIQKLKAFWKSKGVDERFLNMVDGSGLSPANRVTTSAQVAVLLHARKQKWFPAFFNAFPVYNGMTMKSGTIGGVKGFCGYHSSGGKEYVFSFLVNNYNGDASALVNKMYKVLNVLKGQ